MMKSGSPERWPRMGALTTQSPASTCLRVRSWGARPWLVNVTLVSSISYSLPSLDRRGPFQILVSKGSWTPVGPFHAPCT